MRYARAILKILEEPPRLRAGETSRKRGRRARS
jgi:hypothetical protein